MEEQKEITEEDCIDNLIRLMKQTMSTSTGMRALAQAMIGEEGTENETRSMQRVNASFRKIAGDNENLYQHLRTELDKHIALLK